MDKRIDYTNVDFPEETHYIRKQNRIYSSTDPEDGEMLTYYCRHAMPIGNSLGYRWYKRENGMAVLVHYKEIEI